MKYRADGQGSKADLDRRNLRAELEDKEREHTRKKLRTDEMEGGGVAASLEAGRGEVRRLVPKAIDADDSGDSDDSDEDSDDDEDDTAELMAELEKIKRERAEDAARKEAEAKKAEQEEKEKELMRGNPLLPGAAGADFTVKRRWDDDVVFKNQARNEPKAERRFVNDTIRSDFHRRFMTKYMK
mmetsp:Transcript_30586/g.97639  ORF Transcript_30586/g.97639 Transcript_30586/m.97639 type:complete len:184 (-) Transcript_30586:341-892(-)